MEKSCTKDTAVWAVKLCMRGFDEELETMGCVFVDDGVLVCGQWRGSGFGAVEVPSFFLLIGRAMLLRCDAM
jgi:hypothetical protein